ncbi:hypothetical protein [Microbacterium saperdae]|nr:hypothetical protein [Microbacterium saperdae]
MPEPIIAAVRLGGRISCLTLLQLIGVFVHSCREPHVHVPPHLSRSRGRRQRDLLVHWGTRLDEGEPHMVSIRDAVLQSVRCQSPRASIATLDSVLHHGLLRQEDLVQIFTNLPLRYHPLLALVDASAESGPETYLRLILRSLGLRFETQVHLPGVGRVDFLVEGWLVIECDSRAFHQGWDRQVRDRRRDIAAARLGYVTIRPLASDLLEAQARVRSDLQAVVDAFGSRLSGRAAPQLRRKSAQRRDTSASSGHRR